MLVREVVTNCKTGEVTERMVEMDVMTVEQAALQEAAARGDEARTERFRRLVACDWTTLSDVPLSEMQRAEWATYRQALRDVTAQAGFPDAIQWPEPPAELVILDTPTRGDIGGVS